MKTIFNFIKVILLTLILLTLVGIYNKLHAQYSPKTNDFTLTHYSTLDGIVNVSLIAITVAYPSKYGEQMSQKQIAISQWSGLAITAGYNIFRMSKLHARIKHKFTLRKQLRSKP